MTHFHTSNLPYNMVMFRNLQIKMADRSRRFTTSEVMKFFQLDHSPNEDGSDDEESFKEYIGRRLSDSESIDDSLNVDDSEKDQSIGEDECPMSVSSENVSPGQFETTSTLVGLEQMSSTLSDVSVNLWQSSDSEESVLPSDKDELFENQDTSSFEHQATHIEDNTSSAEEKSGDSNEEVGDSNEEVGDSIWWQR